jgi:hypothetical protein
MQLESHFSLCLYIENAMGKAIFVAIGGIRAHRHRFATAWKATCDAKCSNVNPGRAKNLVFYEIGFI